MFGLLLVIGLLFRVWNWGMNNNNIKNDNETIKNEGNALINIDFNIVCRQKA